MISYSQVIQSKDTDESSVISTSIPQRDYVPSDNSFKRTGYKMYKNQGAFKKCARYISAFGCIFILYGITNILFYSYACGFEIVYCMRNPNACPTAPLLVSLFGYLLDSLNSCCTVWIGILFIKKTSKPSRDQTWELWKKTMRIMAIKLAIVVIVELTFGLYMLNASYNEYGLGQGSEENGEHKIKFKIKQKSRTGATEYKETKEYNGYSSVLLMNAIVGLVLPLSCILIYSACILCGLYKYHSIAKEIETIQDNPPAPLFPLPQLQPIPASKPRSYSNSSSYNP
ncbi:unnamed protein product [Moneuplotes crassus]|uniref:Uncharacterized protein n=1 Tax=Euplotes crassus TaxID=5936 RepID=A0AAD1XIZ3_EUPCR|nr:unnamed protein product [Moneuplotes crassus]